MNSTSYEGSESPEVRHGEDGPAADPLIFKAGMWVLGLSGCALLYVLLSQQNQFAVPSIAAIVAGLALAGVGFRKIRHHQPESDGTPSQEGATTRELLVPAAVLGMLVVGCALVAFSVLGAGVLVLLHVVANAGGEPAPAFSPFTLVWVFLVGCGFLLAFRVAYSIIRRAESRTMPGRPGR
jgi:hypothetical protein